jgi:hypothetical protein
LKEFIASSHHNRTVIYLPLNDMALKISLCLLMLTLTTSACGSSGAPVAASIPPTQEKRDTAVRVQPTVPGTEAASVPKHKDLTFVEFFAVT